MYVCWRRYNIYASIPSILISLDAVYTAHSISTNYITFIRQWQLPKVERDELPNSVQRYYDVLQFWLYDRSWIASGSILPKALGMNQAQLFCDTKDSIEESAQRNSRWDSKTIAPPNLANRSDNRRSTAKQIHPTDATHQCQLYFVMIHHQPKKSVTFLLAVTSPGSSL